MIERLARITKDDITITLIPKTTGGRSIGYWRSEHGVIGDGPADALDAALNKIVSEFYNEYERAPSQGELADLIEFCTGGQLSPQCGDPKHPYIRHTFAGDFTPRAKEHGRQGVFVGWGDKGLREETTEDQGRADDAPDSRTSSQAPPGLSHDPA